MKSVEDRLFPSLRHAPSSRHAPSLRSAPMHCSHPSGDAELASRGCNDVMSRMRRGVRTTPLRPPTSSWWVLLAACCFLLFLCDSASALGEVIWAVNAGGGSHVDSNGIHYQKDMLSVGHASDHGKNIGIRRVAMQDQILYQTERYHTSNFAYTLPVKADGDYVLVVKFSEVWFTEPGQKVFNVQLNDQHKIVDELDIFAAAGLGVAHDEIVPFSVRKGQLLVNDESSSFDGTLKIEFIKLNRDNPKVNAIYVMRGSIEDVPQLPPIPKFDRPPTMEADDDDEEEGGGADGAGHKSAGGEKRRRPVQETRVADPYASEDPSSMMLPVLAAIGAFIPLVFCLCRL